MKIFFPMSPEEAESAVEGVLPGGPLYGVNKVEYDLSGADEDAVWVEADISVEAATAHEDADSNPEFLGFREYTFPDGTLRGTHLKILTPEQVSEALREPMRARVERLAEHFSGRVSADRLSQVGEFIRRDELDKAFVALAWAVNGENVAITPDELLSLRSSRLTQDLPPSLVDLVR